MSQQAASQWLDRLGIDWKAASLDDIRVGYIRSLRDQAAGRAATGELNLTTERALLAREQRERIRMENAVTRRELAPVALIEEVLAKAGSRVAGILDAIPGMIKRRVAALSSADLDLIAGEVARARNIAAAISLDDLRHESPFADDDEGPG